LTAGDQVRVRITAVSVGRAGSSGKIGVTARQPFLGKLDWLKIEQSKENTGEKKPVVADKAV
jgi:DNA-directed RNA polymerase subunit E'